MPIKKAKLKFKPRFVRTRLNNPGLIEGYNKVQEETGWTDADIVREAIKEYIDRERLRDDIAAMDQRFGATVDRLIKMQRTMRSEMAVLVAFMHEFSGLYLFHTVEPPEDVREAAAADAARRHDIFIRRVERAWTGGNPLDELATAEDREPGTGTVAGA
jgi:hypothetical protein